MLLLAVVFLAAPCLRAQVTTSGSISGYILDDTKEPLPGATLTATSPTSLGTHQTVSDVKGHFKLSALPAGKYKIVVELSQFKTVTRLNVEVNVGAMLNMDFVMAPKTVTESEVIVTAPAPLVETEKTTMDTVITNQILNSLPILGRDFMQSIKILPGVTNSDYGVSISGGRDTDKNYNIDGTDNIDIIQGQIFGGASYQMNLNKSFMTFDQEAIQELSVGTGAYSADVGFGSGGLINVVTKSGSNNFHGSLYLYARSDSWDKDVRYPYKDYNFGGSLGGPIVKDKLLFFMSINPTYNKTGYDPLEVYNQGIPSDLQDSSKGVSSFAKFSYLLNNKHNLTLSMNVPYSSANSYVTLWHVTPDFPWMKNKSKGYSLTLNETANLSSSLIIESILAGGQTRDEQTSDPTAHQGFIYIYGTDGSLTAAGTYGANNKFTRNKLNWSEKLTYFIDDWAGRHSLGAGFEVRYNKSSQWQAVDEVITRFVGEVDEKEITPEFTQALHQTYVAGYIADSWTPFKRLTLKPGIRISRNSYRPKTLIEPRFDFAYDPIGDAKTIIRGGANLYYERMNAYMQQFENYPLLRFENVYADGTIERSTEEYRNLVVDPNLKYPKTTELTLGIDREVIKDLSVQANFIYRKYRDQIFTRKINLRDRTTGLRDDPTKSLLDYYSNSGKSDYKGLTLVLEKRYSHGYQFLVSYSHQVSKGNSNLFTDFSMLQTIFRDKWLYKDSIQAADLWGRTSFDKPYDFKAFGSVMLPLKFMVSAVFNVTAGSPYTEYIRTSTVRAMVSAFNVLRSPKTMNLDARLEKDFRIKNMTAKVMVEAFNLMNRVNILEVDSNVASSTYGEPYDIGAPRRIQLGFRFEF